MGAEQSVSYAVAFVAGVLSFLSPCVLPLIPGYVAFLSGRSLDELTSGESARAVLRTTLVRAGVFCLGFTGVFTVMGATASAAGQLLLSALPVLTKVAGGVIIIFGVHTTGLVQIPWLNYERRISTHRVAPSVVGAGVMGAAFAFGWTPCIGPILGSILALAATQDTVLQGMWLLLVYSMGLGVPFVFTAAGIGVFLKFFARYKRLLRWSEIGAGVLLVVLGVLVLTNQLTVVIQWIPSSFYDFAR